MHDDDRPIGRRLSRRELVGLFGASVAAAAATAHAHGGGVGFGAAEQGPPGASLAAQDCVAQPQQTEGPYFVEERLKRSDIRVDPSTGSVSRGASLDLRLVISTVTDTGVCQPLADAQVDIWHCDAAGVYSDVRDRRSDTIGQKFLRGYQTSDASGQVRFTTIYPGWYAGRAVHVHFKVRTPDAGGRTDEFTSQLYFDDALTDRVHATAPYSDHPGQRLVNSRDMIFREGGPKLTLLAVEHGDGYAATFRIAMRPGEPPAPGPPGPPPFGRGVGRGGRG
jgi:protocatechuate 3,4-dioxygenase beta subunit